MYRPRLPRWSRMNWSWLSAFRTLRLCRRQHMMILRMLSTEVSITNIWLSEGTPLLKGGCSGTVLVDLRRRRVHLVWNTNRWSETLSRHFSLYILPHFSKIIINYAFHILLSNNQKWHYRNNDLISHPYLTNPQSQLPWLTIFATNLTPLI